MKLRPLRDSEDERSAEAPFEALGLGLVHEAERIAAFLGGSLPSELTLHPIDAPHHWEVVRGTLNLAGRVRNVPRYAKCQEKTRAQITVFVLEPMPANGRRNR